MRLIDADALINTLQNLFDKREKEQVFTGGRGATVTWNDAIYHIKSAPTIDAVPVIRCKDCKHMGDVYLVSLPWLEQKEHRCRYWERPTTPDDYCNRAERKEE